MKLYIQYVSTRPPQVNFGVGAAGAAGAGAGAAAGGGAIGAAAGGGAAGGGAGGAASGGAAGVCANARSGVTTAIASMHARSRIKDPLSWFPGCVVTDGADRSRAVDVL